MALNLQRLEQNSFLQLLCDENTSGSRLTLIKRLSEQLINLNFLSNCFRLLSRARLNVYSRNFVLK